MKAATTLPPGPALMPILSEPFTVIVYSLEDSASPEEDDDAEEDEDDEDDDEEDEEEEDSPALSKMKGDHTIDIKPKQNHLEIFALFRYFS